MTNLPQVVSRDEWLAARKELLASEKELTRARDGLNAERRRLPTVRVDRNHVFDGPDGGATLLDLYEGRRQLIVYHFMFDPRWDEGCNACSFLVDSMGHLAHLHARDTSLALRSAGRTGRAGSSGSSIATGRRRCQIAGPPAEAAPLRPAGGQQLREWLRYVFCPQRPLSLPAGVYRW